MAILVLSHPQRSATKADFSWFDSTKYDALSSFDLEAWIKLITDRFIGFVNIFDENIPSEPDQLLMDNICERPLAFWRGSESLPSSILDEYGKEKLLPVSALEVGSMGVCQIEHYPQQDLRLAIDVSADDDLILKQVKAFVVEHRKEKQRLKGLEDEWEKPLFNKTRFNAYSLIKFRAVEIMDLMLWAKAAGMFVSYDVICSVIYPSFEDVKTGDNIRDVVRRYIRPLLTEEVIARLEARFYSGETSVLKRK